MSSGLSRLLADAQSETLEHDPPLRVAEMQEDDAFRVFKALSGESTCRIYTEIQESPKTASELQAEFGTSLQNIHYHLEKLTDAGLVESIGTRYSEKGIEMSVFGATHSPLVISFAPAPARARVRNALMRLFGTVVVLAGISVAVELAFSQSGSTVPLGKPSTVNVSATAPSLAPPGPIDIVLQTPGLIVFIVGLLLLSTYVTWRVAAQY